MSFPFIILLTLLTTLRGSPAQITIGVVFERAVHTYIERSSNRKNTELSFAKAECRREFLKFRYGNPSVSIHQPALALEKV